MMREKGKGAGPGGRVDPAQSHAYQDGEERYAELNPSRGDICAAHGIVYGVLTGQLPDPSRQSGYAKKLDCHNLAMQYS
jgi:hypothetical protein